jgi:hypothetical protein
VQYQPIARAIYGTKIEPQNEKHIRSLAKKFQDWREKKKTKQKNCFISIESNLCLPGSFKTFLKTARKGLERNCVQFGRHVFLNILSILKPLSFEDRFHLWKEKMQSRKLGFS